jgi:hypothetical protein
MSILCRTESDGVVVMQHLRVMTATSYHLGSPGLRLLHSIYMAEDGVPTIVRAGCRLRVISSSSDPANGLR